MNGAPVALRRGWTTGACATAAAKAAYVALLTGAFPDPVEIVLPLGRHARFALAERTRDEGGASAGVVKDAGDDPDVTHGALVRATVRRGAPGTGVRFRAGEGVGTVTKPGLPLAVGEPAINPMPRKMMTETLSKVAAAHGRACDLEVTIAIPGGAAIAERTMNARLGILGGLSILGTTGVVIPYSCAAWIATIHEGVDVARAAGLVHIAGATGSTSEAAVARVHGLSETALIEMGDFAGGLLTYVRRKPVPRVTVAGGFAKISKLAQGALDLHSRRSALDLGALADLAGTCGAAPDVRARIATAETGLDALRIAQAAQVRLADAVAAGARAFALEVIGDAPIELDVLVVDRDGVPLAHAR